MLTEQQIVYVPAPVIEVLKAASVELRELKDRQTQLTKRIRTLRSTMTALQNLQHSRRASCEQDESGTAKHTSADNGTDPELRRACRIAMLEALEGLTKEEVLARIVRRGSYRFAHLASAKTAIRRELSAMVEEGELECETYEFGWKWKRVATTTSAR